MVCKACGFDLRIVSVDAVPTLDDRARATVTVPRACYVLAAGKCEPTGRFRRSVERDRERWRGGKLTHHELLRGRTVPLRRTHDRATAVLAIPLPTSIVCALCSANNDLALSPA
jgi:hypothetical protein